MIPQTEAGLPLRLAKSGCGAGMLTVHSKKGLTYAQSVGYDAMTQGYGSVSSGAQNGDLLQLLPRNLHGFSLDIIAHAELVDGDELIAAFQPGPRFNGQGDFPGIGRPC